MKITFLDGKKQGSVLEFSTPSVTIGRDPSNMLTLNTDGVSRCHAELRQLPEGSWVVVDLNSTNGVKLDGARIAGQAPLADGSRMEIGENLMELSELNSAPAQVIFNPIVTPPLAENASKPVFDAPPVRGDMFMSSEAKTVPIPESALAPETPPAAEKPKEEPPKENLAEDLKKLSGSLFARKGKASSGGLFGSSREGEQGADAAASPEAERRKRRSNLIFYVILGCVVVMVLSWVLKPAGKAVASQGGGHVPLVVRYEKEVITRNNVFRFEFYLRSRIEQSADETAAPKKTGKGRKAAPVQRFRRVYYANFTIDDIASHRHYSKETPISEETVDELRSAIRSSGIYASAPNTAPRDREQNRSLLIVEGDRIFSTGVPGEFASTEFNAVEEAVVSVAESFGLKTIALTPEQLLKQAEDYFLKAEDLYDNRAKISNLRDAIMRYRAVVESLEQFSPKPKMWDQAKKKLDVALRERDAKMRLLDAEFNRLSQMNDFAAMRQVFLDQMELAEPESREYAKAKNRLVIIDQALRKNKRK